MTRLALLLLGAASAVAHADAPLEKPYAFEVDREVPPPGQGELSFDGGAPVDGWAASIQLGYVDRPMRLHTTEVKTFPVEHRQTLALGGAVAVGTSVLLDARMPLAHQVGDRLRGLGVDDKPLDRWVAGDLTLGLRLRVTTRPRFAAFVRGQLTMPTGNDKHFAGDARFSAAWMLIGRFRLPAGVTLAATGGVRIRGAEVQIYDRLLGDELFGAIGATYKLPAIRGLYCDENQVRLTGELVGVLGSRVQDTLGPSPVEARVGVISRIRPWLGVAVRVGKGIGDQIGGPRFRGMLELVYTGL